MRAHRRRGATLVAALVGAVVVLAGCAGIPTDGPVTEANVELPDTGGVIPIAADDPTPVTNGQARGCLLAVFHEHAPRPLSVDRVDRAWRWRCRPRPAATVRRR